MRLKFTKMQGLGNDFVVLDATRAPLALDRDAAARARRPAFRRRLRPDLVVEPPRSPDTDFRYRIFNADGGEVEQCGNGARCFVRFVRDAGLTDKTEIRVGTQAGVIVPKLEADGAVTVDMGVPRVRAGAHPVPRRNAARCTYRSTSPATAVEISALSMGNPHAVQVVDDVDAAPVPTEGPLIETHPRFPQRVNAGYMQVVDRGRHPAARLGARRGRDARVRHRRVRRGRRRHPARTARLAWCVTTRGGDLGISWHGRGRAGDDDRPGGDGVRRRG